MVKKVLVENNNEVMGENVKSKKGFEKEIKMEIVIPFLNFYYDDNIELEIRRKSVYSFYKIHKPYLKNLESESNIVNFKKYFEKSVENYSDKFETEVIGEFINFLESKKNIFIKGELSYKKYLYQFRMYFIFALKKVLVNLYYGDEVITNSSFWNDYYNSVVAYISFNTKNGIEISRDKIDVESFVKFLIDTDTFYKVFQNGNRNGRVLSDKAVFNNVNLIYTVLRNDEIKGQMYSDISDEKYRNIKDKLNDFDEIDYLIDLSNSLDKVEKVVEKIANEEMIKGEVSYSKEIIKNKIAFHKEEIDIDVFRGDLSNEVEKYTKQQIKFHDGIFEYAFNVVQYSNFEDVVKDYIMYECSDFIYDIFNHYDILDIDVIDEFILSFYKTKGNLNFINLKNKLSHEAKIDDVIIKFGREKVEYKLKNMVKEIDKYIARCKKEGKLISY